jgi:hypothetical protein
VPGKAQENKEMLELMIAAALTQSGAADPCHAVGPAPRPAACRQWRPLHRDGHAELFVDPASLRRDATGFEIMMRMVFATPQEEEGMRSSVSTNRFDCAARTWALRHSAFYDSSGALIVEGQITGEAGAPGPVEPDNPVARILTEFCPR